MTKLFYYICTHIPQCGSTVYIGIAQVTQHQPCTLEIQVFTFTLHFSYLKKY